MMLVVLRFLSRHVTEIFIVLHLHLLIWWPVDLLENSIFLEFFQYKCIIFQINGRL